MPVMVALLRKRSAPEPFDPLHGEDPPPGPNIFSFIMFVCSGGLPVTVALRKCSAPEPFDPLHGEDPPPGPNIFFFSMFVCLVSVNLDLGLAGNLHAYSATSRTFQIFLLMVLLMLQMSMVRRFELTEI